MPVPKDFDYDRWLGPALTAPIEEARRSATMCQIGNIAMKLGRKLRWDPKAEQFLDDAEANRMLSRPQRSPYTLKEMA